MSILSARGLRKSFGGVVAVDGIDLDIDRGEMLAMIGPNGAGKTTCFNLLNGQLRPDAGTVTLHGRPIAERPPRALWRQGVSRTFQITATFPSMTVLENVQTVLLSVRQQGLSLRPWISRRRLDKAFDLLERVGMANQADRSCSVLAYGDLKRLELVMALANAPSLLLMDEPTAGMAPKERVALMQMITEIAREQRLGVLFTEHDMDAVFAHAHRVLVLNRGRVLVEGPPDVIRRDPQVREVYLGDSFLTTARHAPA